MMDMTDRRTDVWNHIVALAAYTHDCLYPCGTAFLVGKNLAMTATHVLDQPFDRRLHDIPDIAAEEFSVVAIQVINRSPSPLLWRVKSMGRYPSFSGDNDRPFDVGLLALTPYGEAVPEIETFRGLFFELNVATPRVNTRIVAYGFTKSQLQQNLETPIEYTLAHTFQRVEATITAVHYPMRDQVGMPFPCFEIDGDFDPGMSGGPVLNDRDQVCGVISRGSGLGISWASVLWPALGISIEGKTGLQLAYEGAMRVRNLHCVQLRSSPDSEFPEVRFDPNCEIQ